MPRELISNGSNWELTVGYSRAVRVGQFVFVSGTTAVDDEGRPIGVGDPHAQTAAALGRIAAALKEAGAGLADVVQTRMFVTDITDWQAVGRAHGEIFGDVRPVTTMVEVARLIDLDLLVEIEAVALLDA